MAEETADSITPSVRGFSDMDYLYTGGRGYSYSLTNLFTNQSKNLLPFDDAKNELIKTIEDAFANLESQTDREVTDFIIGKTFVKTREKQRKSFDVMNPKTWRLDGGINGRWQSYRKDNYDGLFAIACIDKDTVPTDIRGTNHQWYTFVFEQILIIHFKYSKKDIRIRNKSTCTGGVSKSHKGGIVYVAYKLKPEEGDNQTNYKYDEASMQSFSEMLKDIHKLEFNAHIPMDGNSFFRACCHQLQDDDIDDTFEHNELRQMVYLRMKRMNKQQQMDISSEISKETVFEIKQDGVYVDKDYFIEIMARELNRPIFMYSLGSNCIDITKFNNDTSENLPPPLLLARVNFVYQSLGKILMNNTGEQSQPTATAVYSRVKRFGGAEQLKSDKLEENQIYQTSSKKQNLCNSSHLNKNEIGLPTTCNRYSLTDYRDVTQVYIPPVPANENSLTDYLVMLNHVLHSVKRRRQEIETTFLKHLQVTKPKERERTEVVGKCVSVEKPSTEKQPKKKRRRSENEGPVSTSGTASSSGSESAFCPNLPTPEHTLTRAERPTKVKKARKGIPTANKETIIIID